MGEQSAGERQKVRMVTIDDGSEGQRIDNFLLRELKGVPKSRVYRIIRKGEVRINKSRCKAEYKLKVGDVVRIPPVVMADKPAAAKVSGGLQALLADAVLYEDDSLLVINKPSGLAVHGGSGINLGLIEALRAMRPDARFLELVHRLDRDTSGCVLIAKKRSMLRYLHMLLRDGHMDKRYMALVSGRWPNRRKLVNEPLLKNNLQSGERMVRVSPEGKRSRTEFTVVERYQSATLVQAKPITGRTHQIRVHAQFVGCAILGDDKYADPDDNRRAKSWGLRRLFLHAASLRFRLPDGAGGMSDRYLELSAPLGEELDAVLAALPGVA